MGAYVTTGTFSAQAQLEMLEDGHPLLLIHGGILAATAYRLMSERGLATIEEFLDTVDATYDERVSSRDPARVVFDD